jgi:hypothetical protein
MKTGLRVKREGCTRLVVLVGRYALKFPRFDLSWKLGLQGMLCNMQEAEFGRGEWPELAPITFAIPGGFLVIQRRCEPMPDDVWATFNARKFIRRREYHLPVEEKQDSFGILDGQIVAFDYGS